MFVVLRSWFLVAAGRVRRTARCIPAGRGRAGARRAGHERARVRLDRIDLGTLPEQRDDP